MIIEVFLRSSQRSVASCAAALYRRVHCTFVQILLLLAIDPVGKTLYQLLLRSDSTHFGQCFGYGARHDRVLLIVLNLLQKWRQAVIAKMMLNNVADGSKFIERIITVDET